MVRFTLNAGFSAILAVVALQAQTTFSSDAKANFERISANVLKAAEKMQDSEYGFKPTPDVRNFGQLIAHVADAQTGICGIAKGEPKHGDAATKTTKSDLIAALKASIEACEAVYSAITDTDGAAIVKTPFGDKPKLGVLNLNVAHDNEMYGAIAVYLRLKGIVPPSSEKK
jgi:hypothetical protein